jgi:hypothetical protein
VISLFFSLVVFRLFYMVCFELVVSYTICVWFLLGEEDDDEEEEEEEDL